MKALTMENVHASYSGNALTLFDPAQADAAPLIFIDSHGNLRRDSLPIGLQIILSEQVEVHVAKQQVRAIVQERVIDVLTQKNIIGNLAVLLWRKLVQQSKNNSGCKKIKVFFSESCSFLDVDINFLESPVLVFKE